jgi:hypothetical protein
MSEESECPDPGMPASGRAREANVQPLCLGTLQRNALRKLLNQPEFTPEQVHALGYRRIQRAEGIGQKGMQRILAWLRAHGLELSPPESPPERPPERLPPELRQHIHGALRLLRTHGYRVRRISGKSSS